MASGAAAAAAPQSSLFGATATGAKPRRDNARGRQPWINSFDDPAANARAFSSCVRTADLSGDGNFRLVLANNTSHQLKVFKDTRMAAQQDLLSDACAVVSFYSEVGQVQPSLAVASGRFVFIYRNLHPYFKFNLPSAPVNIREEVVWQQLVASQIDLEQAVRELHSLHEEGEQLTGRSLKLVELKGTEEQQQLYERVKLLPLYRHTVCTCMEVLSYEQEGEHNVGCLVIGTEAGEVLILDPSGTKVQQCITGLPSVPTMLACTGVYKTKQYRIVVACRNNKVYNLRHGKVYGSPIELEAPPSSICLLEKHVVVGTMDHNVLAFQTSGEKVFSIFCNAPVIAVQPMLLSRARVASVLVVALKNGEVRLYRPLFSSKKRRFVNTLDVGQPIAGIRVGPYGREDMALAVSCASGALIVKMLSRHANLEGSAEDAVAESSTHAGPSLRIPRKSSLFAEQTQRERDQGSAMFRIFQRDLAKLRLNAARSYVKLITDGHGPMSASRGAKLRLDATVQGLGPAFKLHLAIKNTSRAPLVDVPVSVVFDHAIYTVEPSLLEIPVLVPGLTYKHQVSVRCIDPNGASAPIRVFACSAGSTVPAISATVNMPMSELNEEDVE